MKKLVLIRHSKTIFEPKVPNPQWILSEDGQELAKKLAETDVVGRLGVLYTSDQTKALETAVLLARPHRLSIRVKHDLTEVTSITKKFFDNFEATVEAFHNGKIERINEGESVAEAKSRINEALEAIANETKDVEMVGLVAHGNILSILAAQYEDRHSYDIHHHLSMPDIAILDWSTKTFDIRFGDLV